ncbi:SDR family NAD(P)-dependent oxidoreductase [Amycolatopsis sp. H20-H5]|uniref:SDR family NAD(P)-dependent oxidoreductase n=1 Tax=Amycolatopsis sp. H20-H5 TaxID=3046309 RepID=UPI002DB93FC5|nr:SDR family NAD(P)-dependent oxidoreductase [Amycolatopsis sp. H20-H5]MEC3976809.1 SDR family NAD(P)-dependent oxidoreductase [Amycolatopsis sp. H20-H5]
MSAPHRRITTRFDASSTADDVVAGLDLTGVRAIVTGASSGIGVETARSLARAGAEVTLAVRNVSAGEKTAEDIAESTGGGHVHVGALDLVDRSSIAEFTGRWTGPLHILINNAGVIVSDLARTPEGWELQFATNHLGHFALTLGLREALAAGARERGGARVVSLSSTAHMRSPVVFDDIHFERREYDPQAAYSQSKTANSLFAVEATRQWAADGIVANTVNPGGVSTGLQRDFTPRQKDYLAAAEAAGAFVYKTVQQGAATTLVAAVAPEFARTGGHYLDDGRQAHTVGNDATLFDNSHGVKEWALDPGAARQLWTVSLDLIGLPAPGETSAS